MIRMPLASASLLAIAIALAGCGEGKDDKAAAPQAQAPAAASTTAAAPGAVDEAAGKAVVKHYAEMVYAVYSDSLSTAKTLQSAVDAFLAKPNDETLKAAKQAWVAARVPYLQTEPSASVTPSSTTGKPGERLAAGRRLIDYVDKSYEHALGNPAAGANIIANTEIQVGEEKVDVKDITPEKLASLNELAGSEANVATGYHAIEFLLWGQDLNGTGPGAGNRPASDYLEGQGATGGHNDRRRTYLKAVTDLLVTDLEEMVGNWAPNVADNYRAKLEAEPVNDGLRKMLFGMGSLSLGELAGERMKVSLEANSPEDEQDCFSDNTHYSHFYDAKGIRNVYLASTPARTAPRSAARACRRWWPKPILLPTPPSRPTWKPLKPRSR